MNQQTNRMQYERRIAPAELCTGHFVVRMSVPWRQTDYPLEGVLIKSENTRRWMVENCAWVDIDIARSSNKHQPPHYSPRASQASAADQTRLALLGSSRIDAATLESAGVFYQGLELEVERMIERLASGRGIDPESARSVVSEVVDHLEHNLAALLWMTRIKERDQYTAQHCINVSILAIALAHAAGWSRLDAEEAGLAGLLHDLGKMQLDPEILNKPGKLKPEEFDHVKTHTTIGYDLVRDDPNVPLSVAAAVRSHHERPDGTGYPDELPNERIPALAFLVAVVDAYDAITSNRAYDPARSHHQALGILWKARGKQFDSDLVEVFIALMGWVSPGTLVRLNNGELAVVMESRSGRGLYPLVHTVTREPDGPRPGKLIDLADPALRESTGALRVAEVLPDGSEGVDVRELIEQFRQHIGSD